MGTSVSSTGPGPGVRLVPQWVDDAEGADPTSPADSQNGTQGDEDEANVRPEVPTPISPNYRFRGANSNLNQFARYGSASDMRRGLGLYVRNGLGTSRWATQRMAGTARRAGALYGVLNALSTGAPLAVDLGIDTESLAGHSAREIVDRIVEALIPTDGTQDSEASRSSLFKALSRLINREPTADLVALTLDQIELAIELFISEDICRRIDLDVGVAVMENAPSVITALNRIEEMYRYVRHVVALSFRHRVLNSRRLTQRNVTGLVSGIIRNVFRTFESYLL